MTNKTRGFTLIELLVVIAIIGILASVVLASLNSARQKAMNAGMLSQVGEYMRALELYFNDNGHYPMSSTPTTYVCLGDYADGGCWNNNSFSENATLITALSPHIPGLPGEGTGATYEGFIYNCTTAECRGYNISWFIHGGNLTDNCGPGVVHAGNTGDGITRCILTR